MTLFDPHEMGVWSSTVADSVTVDGQTAPYISRNVDAQLDQAFLRSPETAAHMVVAVGRSKSGKSRSLYEAVVRNCSDFSLAVIEKPTPRNEKPFLRFLGDAEHRSSTAEDLLIWIDDAHEHLGRGLTSTNLATLSQWFPGATVALSMHEDALEKLLPAQGSAHPVLELPPATSGGDPLLHESLYRNATRVSIRLSATEVLQAKTIYGQVLDRIGLGRTERLARSLSAADYHVERFVAARFSTGTKRVEAAILRASCLFYLYGERLFATEHQLRAFAEMIAFNDGSPSFSFGDREWRKAFARCQEPTHGAASLILASEPEVDPMRWRPFDPLLEVESAPPNDWVWSFLISTAEPHDLLAIGQNALDVLNLRGARQAWGRVVKLDHPDTPEARAGLRLLGDVA